MVPKTIGLGSSPGTSANILNLKVMGNLYLAIYIIVGLFLSIFWWNKKYKRDYDYAKAKEDGVEDGMAVLFLLI